LLAPWLKFFRLRLSPTAISNVVAGATIGGWNLVADEWCILICWTMALYMFGMGLNDLADRSIDKKLAPHRPLPAGDLSVAAARHALGLLAICITGLTLAMPEPIRFHAFTAIACVLLYDLGFKKVPILGPLAMGGVRFSIVMLAASYSGGIEHAWIHAIRIGAFTAAITYFSEAEQNGTERTLTRRLFLLGIVALLISIPFPPLEIEVGNLSMRLLLGGVLLWWITRAFAFQKGVAVHHCTITLVMGLPLVDLIAVSSYPWKIPSFIVILAWLSLRPWTYFQMHSTKTNPSEDSP
jgi:4-hydroxybenzoate polyprenyltransferase